MIIMTVYDYKVVPAPTKGRKARGIRGSDQKFAYAIETIMNEMAQDGWSYCQIWCLRISGHAAIWLGLVVSIPSLNETPVMTLAR